jgi:hypothetical protein
MSFQRRFGLFPKGVAYFVGLPILSSDTVKRARCSTGAMLTLRHVVVVKFSWFLIGGVRDDQVFNQPEVPAGRS